MRSLCSCALACWLISILFFASILSSSMKVVLEYLRLLFRGWAMRYVFVLIVSRARNQKRGVLLLFYRLKLKLLMLSILTGVPLCRWPVQGCPQIKTFKSLLLPLRPLLVLLGKLLLLDDPLPLLVLVLIHRLFIVSSQMLLVFEELSLEPWVRIYNRPPLPNEGQSVKHRKTQFLHEVRNHHWGASRDPSITIVNENSKEAYQWTRTVPLRRAPLMKSRAGLKCRPRFSKGMSSTLMTM